jgi:hypothetical protein
MTFARDGAGSRPLAVTIAGWILIADAVVVVTIIIIPTLSAGPLPVPVVIVGAVFFAAMAALEIWVGRSLLNRRRWAWGIALPAFLLIVGFLPAEGERPLHASMYWAVSSVAYVLVLAALILNRRWFREVD